MDLGSPQIRAVLPRRAAVLLLFAASTSVAWCPEAPVLGRLQGTMCGSALAMSPEEMTTLLARHDMGRLPGDFRTIALAVDEVSRRHGIAPELVLAVIRAESAFRRDAVSQRGAIGLMQLMPGTAEELAMELDMPWTGWALLHDPRANITLGAFYLSKLLATFEDLDRALMAYNRGPAATPRAGVPRPRGETAAFIRRVREMLVPRDPLNPARSFGDPYPFKASRFLSL